MDSVSKHGLMELATKATGKIIELSAKASLCILMEMFTKATGLMTRQTVLEFMFMLMELDTKVCGRMISSMVEAKKVGPMAQFILVNISRGKNTVEVFTVGTTAVNTMVNGLKTRLKDLAPIHG